MGTIIRIEEQSGSETQPQQFNLRLIFDNRKFQVTVENPHDENTREKLDRYFRLSGSDAYSFIESGDSYNTLLRDYGESLFDQIFKSTPEIYELYRQIFKQDNFEEIAIEMVGDTMAFHAVLWESIKDPGIDKPLAALGVVFYRKNPRPRIIAASVEAFPWINLLIITSRPDEEDDAKCRIIQKPLVKVIKNSRLKVKPYILRPGTWQSLVDHLRETPPGFYHIVHLDLHGAAADYESLEDQAQKGKILLRNRYLLKDLPVFTGKRTFLFFETHKKGMALPVDASELSELLESKQIPVCILNACPSLRQEQIYYETDYGCELVRRGIPLVLAMRYSLPVPAVETVMETLYEQLFENKCIDAAIALARQKLYNQRSLQPGEDKGSEREDWVLPVVYKNQDPDLNLREFTNQEAHTFYLEKERKHFFIQPSYGFHGRDLDILKIEKHVLLHNQLLLQGNAGVGKTTLLDYLGWWWQETGFIKQVFYFPYDIKAWTVDQVIHDIAEKIYSQRAFELFYTKPYDVQKTRILDFLNTSRHVFIIDNIDFIPAEKPVVTMTLNIPQKEELRKFLSNIKENTFVLIGSRSDEAWIKEGTYRDNVYRLEGFDVGTAFAFARKILAALNLDCDEMARQPGFRELLDVLAGNPQAMQEVLPNLKTHPPEKILRGLKDVGTVDRPS